MRFPEHLACSRALQWYVVSAFCCIKMSWILSHLSICLTKSTWLTFPMSYDRYSPTKECCLTQFFCSFLNSPYRHTKLFSMKNISSGRVVQLSRRSQSELQWSVCIWLRQQTMAPIYSASLNAFHFQLKFRSCHYCIFIHAMNWAPQRISIAHTTFF